MKNFVKAMAHNSCRFQYFRVKLGTETVLGPRIHFYPQQRSKKMVMWVLNWIYLWGSSSGAVESVKYPFIVIIPRFGVVVSVRVPSMGQIALFGNNLSDRNTWCHITVCKKFLRNLSKTRNINVPMYIIP